MSALKSQLIGTWDLVDCSHYKESNPDDKFYPMGQNVQGILIYTADGYMSAQLQAPGQSRFKTENPHGGTEEEYAQAAKNYMAYTGPYYLDESGMEPVLLHHMTNSSFPNWLGTTQRRIFSISMEGDDTLLTLKPEKTFAVDGETIIVQLKWRRVAGNHASSPSAL